VVVVAAAGVAQARSVIFRAVVEAVALEPILGHSALWARAPFPLARTVIQAHLRLVGQGVSVRLTRDCQVNTAGLGPTEEILANLHRRASKETSLPAAALVVRPATTSRATAS
jgi:hypothetical protein